MSDLELELSKRIDAYLEGIADNLDAEMVRTVLLGAIHIEGEIQEEINATSSGKGGLQRSYNAVPVVVDGNTYTSGVYSDLEYARIQDEGGTIKPKTVKNLAIPISDEAKTPGKWPRTWPKDKLQYILTKAGRKLLVEHRKTRTIIHYVLKRSVYIKPKHYLDLAIDNAMPGLEKMFGDGIKHAVKKA